MVYRGGGKKIRVCKRSAAMKAPVGLLSDRTVLRSKMEGLCPDKFRHDAQNADNARKNTAFPPVCKKCAEPQKTKNPTRNLAILRWILVRSRELESLAL